jgi:hypothetical protein
MEDLTNLLLSLSTKEKRLIEMHIKAYSGKNDVTQTLLLYNSIFKVINKEKEGNLNSNILLLKSKFRAAEFKTLKSRLKTKIFEALSNDFYILKNEKLDDVTKQSIRLRKKLSQFILIYNLKGKSKYLLNLLNSIINKSKEYEFYPVLIDALVFSLSVSDYSLEKNGQKTYNKISLALSAAISNINLLREVIDTYNRIRSFENSKKNNQQLKKSLYRFLKEKERLALTSNSGLTLYFFYLLKIIYFEKTLNYTQAAVYCNKLTLLIKDRKSVYRSNRLASALGYSATTAIYGGKYEKAIAFSAQALALFPPYSVNSIIAREYIFYAAFYAKKYRLAKKHLVEIQSSEYKIDEFGKSKYAFWAICLDFAQGRFSKAIKMLLQNQLLTKDKLGWDWQIRVLSILCFIELNKVEEASNAIVALGQYIWRENQKEQIITKRQKRIYIILQKLSIGNFQFKNIKPELNKQLLLITKRNVWQPLTPELVRFDDWLKLKLRR